MISFEDILKELIKNQVPINKIEEVKKSYSLASEIHASQYRQSGEPYIVHPLWVAKNLLDMEVFDPDTISAALLHDTIEDAEKNFSGFSKEDIARIINPTVAELVDGVTKISKLKFSTKDEQNYANIRKLILGLNKDIRIILIKLADRLHNMRTLEFKSAAKQKENALETKNLFVPIASTIGAYRTRSELEDLAFRYINPDAYFKITEQKATLSATEIPYLEAVKEKIQDNLQEKDITNEIITRTKNAYITYKRIQQGYKIENIYDLFYLKILVGNIDDCYRTLATVHKNNPPINGRFKDYIYNPRTNFYQSLHTTVSDQNGKLIKTKIRTYDMDKIAAFGLSSLWNIENGKTQEETQDIIREDCQFAKKLAEIDSECKDNYQFFLEIGAELLTDHVYVYNSNGEILELPKGSTSFDYVCHYNPDLTDQITAILVNGKEESLNYILKNTDRLQIVIKGNVNSEPIKNNVSKKKFKNLLIS